MQQFQGTHTNKLDAKGRVSIPASFRALLRTDAGANASVVLRPSPKHDCIEGFPIAMFAAFATPLQELDMFSADYEDRAIALYASTVTMEADKEGRIVLPESLLTHANITESVVFLGLGRYFLIYEPAAADRRKAATLERGKTFDLTLKVPMP